MLYYICGEFLETEEGLNYLCSENKGADHDQLGGDTGQLTCAFVFTCKKHIFSQCGSYEQHHKKTCILHVKTKSQISCAVTGQLISVFVFAT